MNETQRAAAERLVDNMNLSLETWIEQAENLLRELAAEPVQEPVALMWQHEETGRVTFTTVADPYVGKRWHRIPLYAAPQQRQPLSDEQIRQIVVEASTGSAIKRDGSTSMRIARAIERAHGITGEPT